MNWTPWNDTIDLITSKASLTSAGINAIFTKFKQNIDTLYNTLLNLESRYSYGDQYLEDIIQAVLDTGMPPAKYLSLVTATYENGKIASLNYDRQWSLSYPLTNRTEGFIVNFSYGNTPVTRIRYRNGQVLQTFETVQVPVITTITVKGVKSNNPDRIVSIVDVLRHNEQIYSNPYLPDYVGLNGTVSADDILSDYKYYKHYPISGMQARKSWN